MKYSRTWKRLRSFHNQPRDDGRGRLVDTGNDINLRPDIPIGITGFFEDRTYGYVAPQPISEWPPYDEFVTLPHMVIPRGFVPMRIAGRTIDNSVNVTAPIFGNAVD